MNKVRWGVLSTAKIAVEKVIPAMQKGSFSEITAIASRDIERAKSVARSLEIPKAYGSYEELLSDGEIDAVYNPLPNHLHVLWTAKAAEAGKHVLCEKPIGLDANDARKLLDVRDRTGVKIQEAFMVRTHPQWLETLHLIRAGQIGELRSITGHFSYFNRDPQNIRNGIKEGGGALMDIGCYPITMSRFIFGEEPLRVCGQTEIDPEFGVDRMVSATLEFPKGQAIFTCSTQLFFYQRMQFFGTKGRIEVEIPFNAPNDRPTRIFVDNTGDLYGNNIVTREFPVCDQYTIQGDIFSQAILGEHQQSITLEDSINNMATIDAIFRSAKSGKWESP